MRRPRFLGLPEPRLLNCLVLVPTPATGGVGTHAELLSGFGATTGTGGLPHMQNCLSTLVNVDLLHAVEGAAHGGGACTHHERCQGRETLRDEREPAESGLPFLGRIELEH